MMKRPKAKALVVFEVLDSNGKNVNFLLESLTAHVFHFDLCIQIRFVHQIHRQVNWTESLFAFCLSLFGKKDLLTKITLLLRLLPHSFHFLWLCMGCMIVSWKENIILFRHKKTGRMTFKLLPLEIVMTEHGTHVLCFLCKVNWVHWIDSLCLICTCIAIWKGKRFVSTWFQYRSCFSTNWVERMGMILDFSLLLYSLFFSQKDNFIFIEIEETLKTLSPTFISGFGWVRNGFEFSMTILYSLFREQSYFAKKESTFESKGGISFCCGWTTAFLVCMSGQRQRVEASGLLFLWLWCSIWRTLRNKFKKITREKWMKEDNCHRKEKAGNVCLNDAGLDHHDSLCSWFALKHFKVLPFHFLLGFVSLFLSLKCTHPVCPPHMVFPFCMDLHWTDVNALTKKVKGSQRDPVT